MQVSRPAALALLFRGEGRPIAPGATTPLGFRGTWTSSDAIPAAFTLNGTACTT